jgi:hypothetical protein
MSSASAPHYFITTQPAAKISFVQSIKNVTQIEMRTFVLQIQLPLHRKHRMREFSLCLRLLGHLLEPPKRTSGDYFSSL